MDSNINLNDFCYESQGYSLFEDLEDFNIDDVVELNTAKNDDNKVEKDDFAVDNQVEDEVVYQHHPEGSPKPDQDNPLVQGLVKKLRARFDEDQSMMNATRRFWYKRVTGMSSFVTKMTKIAKPKIKFFSEVSKKKSLKLFKL